MTNTKRVLLVLVFSVVGMMLTGCATVQAPPELVEAIEEGNLSKVESLLDEDPKLVNSTCEKDSRLLGYEDTSPLYNAVWHENKDMVKLLLERGAKVNAKVTVEGPPDSRDAQTPFLLAVKEGKLELLPLLIKHGANLDARDTKGHTALYAIINHGYPMLDENGKATGGTIHHPNAKDTAMLLIENGADLKKANRDAKKDDKTLFHSSVENKLYYLVKILIDRGFDVNEKGRGIYMGVRLTGDYTALHYALVLGHTEIADLLRKNGAVE